MTARKPLTNMLQAKTRPLDVASPTVRDEGAASEAPQPAGGEERMRVVVRLNVEAVEALEDITRELRRKTGKAVPTQRLLEEAVEDLLRKYGRPAVVLPAPTKRAR